jgi:hypothetical protein
MYARSKLRMASGGSAPAGRAIHRVQPCRKEKGGGSFHAVGCLVHLASLIVSSHWNFTARFYPSIGSLRHEIFQSLEVSLLFQFQANH